MSGNGSSDSGRVCHWHSRVERVEETRNRNGGRCKAATAAVKLRRVECVLSFYIPIALPSFWKPTTVVTGPTLIKKNWPAAAGAPWHSIVGISENGT